MICLWWRRIRSLSSGHTAVMLEMLATLKQLAPITRAGQLALTLDVSQLSNRRDSLKRSIGALTSAQKSYLKFFVY